MTMTMILALMLPMGAVLSAGVHETPVKAPPRTDVLLRKNVNQLSLDEANSLKDALHQLQQDKGLGGYEAIAGFHGVPHVCGPPHSDRHVPCCIYGMPVFPHWHRVLMVQYEQALKKHGSKVGVPYWDWSTAGTELPYLFSNTDGANPFESYTIGFNRKKTSRNPLQELFSRNTSDDQNLLYQVTLDVLEEEDYCQFEVMLESLQNRVHFLIGGSEDYSMSTLDYSAFDPIFMIVHSGMDRIWVFWQELQKLRHKPFIAINCREKMFHEPMHPFDYEINTIALTKDHAVPETIFDHSVLEYDYDTMEINGHTVQEIKEIIRKRRSTTRVYLAGAAYGLGKSVITELQVVNDAGEMFPAGNIFLLGSSKEMPWSNEVLHKYDVTEAAHKAGVALDKLIKFDFNMQEYNHTPIAHFAEHAIFLVREANTDYMILNIPIGISYSLTPKLVVPKGTHIRFLPVSEEYSVPIEDLRNFSTFNKCSLPPFPYFSYALNVVHALEPGNYYFASTNPDACKSGKKIYIKVQDH